MTTAWIPHTVALVGAAGVTGGGRRTKGQETTYSGGFARVFATALPRLKRLVLIDQDTTAAQAVVDAIRSKLEERFGDSAASEFAKITITDDLAAASDAGFVLEAIPEVLPAKRDLFAKLAIACPDAILATNTSGLLLDAIVDGLGWSGRSRAVVCHGFTPTHVSPVIEVSRGSATGELTFARACSIWQLLDKHVLRVAQHPMHALNFVGTVLWVRLCQLVEEQAVSDSVADELAKELFRMKIGPFELRRSTGYRALLSNAELLHARFPTLAVPDMLRAAVDSGKLPGVAAKEPTPELLARHAGVARALTAAYLWSIDYLISTGIVLDPFDELDWAIEQALFMSGPRALSVNLAPAEITQMIDEFRGTFGIGTHHGQLVQVLSP
ncbi:MAG: 3-hydroxyacyl-CoA dehydrogenase family protein [Bdellovibrionales bacterium]|nr:3-hydroxyacyl-CoA dehydrogenase family protein [Bdellovibrionales bacterium]